MHRPESPRIIALAGRRIDAPGSQPERFPLERVPAVRDALRARFLERPTCALVSSAACGADLLALELAEELEIPAFVVLPFAAKRFRTSSVTDRPGDWGALFDRIVERARRADRLIVHEEVGEGSAAYAAVNRAILDEAAKLGTRLGLATTAVLVWDGRSRGDGDFTDAFGALAREMGMEVLQVPTKES